MEALLTRLQGADESADVVYPDINLTDLITALTDLNKVVGMSEVKTNIIAMVKFAVVTKNKSRPLLHTLIVGDPGTGKTLIAGILGRIFIALKLIRRRHDSSICSDHAECGSSKKLKATTAKLFYHRTTLTRLKSTLDGRRRTLYEQGTAITRYRHQYHPYLTKNEGLYLDQHRHNLYSLSTQLHELMTSLPSEETDEKEIPSAPELKIITSQQMVAGYVGQTAPKMEELLNSCRGRVVFIDEAYKLCDGREKSDGDFAGLALTMLNEFMDTHRDEAIFIFAGYANKMESVFEMQPGLRSRIKFRFETTPYTPSQLFQILDGKIKDNCVVWEPKLTPAYITQSLHNMTARDIEKLVDECIILTQCNVFDHNADPTVITKATLKAAISKMNVPSPLNAAAAMYI